MSDFKPVIHPWNQPLWEQLTQAGERSNHALLFTGHAGLGKRDVAFALAHRVITKQHAQSASLFAAGSHPDMHLLMPENQQLALAEGDLQLEFAARYLEQHGGKPRKGLSIEQVRKLSLALTTHPHISEHRVIMISHADTLNRNAANGLLKSLEEPPAKTLFILVADEISRLPSTIRSRCSLINFRAPTFAVAQAWLQKEGSLPPHEIDNHLAMANNQPLHAVRLFESGYIETLKTVFNDVNGLWNNRRQSVETAASWQKSGGLRCVEILQKLCADLLRSQLSDAPKHVFFPVQQTWVQSTAVKLSKQRLLATIDALAEAHRLLGTTVDELLVLETVSSQMRSLPISG